MTLERLNEEDLKGDELLEEITRAKAINEVASKIIANGSLVLQAQKLADSRESADTKVPKMLEG